MRRRDLLKNSGLLALAGGVTAIAAKSGGGGNPKPDHQPASNSSTKLSPLPVPAAGQVLAAFVLGKDAEVLDFCGPLEVFAGAVTKDDKPLFSPYMVASTKDPVTVGGGMKVLPAYAFANAPDPKVIVIPAMDMSGNGPDMYDWIRTASKSTDVTMSVCNGAFVLAKTGLLSGKSATAHHGGYFRFAATYPDVKLKRGARFVDEGNLASAGGISSGIDLALHVVERYVGRDLTLDVASGMEYQGQGWLNADSNDAYAKLPDFNETHPICPVCLSDGDRSIKSDYKDKTFYFCSKDEKDFFEKHTDIFEKFLAEDRARSPKLSK